MKKIITLVSIILLPLMTVAQPMIHKITSQNRLDLDVDYLIKGLYLVIIETTDNKKYVQKIFKQ